MTAETPRTQIVAARLDALSLAVAEGRRDEFTMRIPAEPDRDADLVLAEAARMVRDLTAAQTERDAAIAWIGCVRDELVIAGCPPGDRTVALAHLRKVLGDLTAAREQSEARKTALQFAERAIEDAIYTEDGLDGEAGERVLHIVQEAIERGTFDKTKLGELGPSTLQKLAEAEDKIPELIAERDAAREQIAALTEERDGAREAADAATKGVYSATMLEAAKVSGTAMALRLQLTTAEADIRESRARVAELEKLHMLVMHETGDAGCGLMPHHPRDALLILRDAARALLSPSPEPTK